MYAAMQFTFTLNAPREEKEHGEAKEGEGEQGCRPRRADCPGGVLEGCAERALLRCGVAVARARHANQVDAVPVALAVWQVVSEVRAAG